MSQNVIIDGSNLAYRVFHVSRDNPLKDRQERETSVLYGFLRAVAALKTRFDLAKVYVVWDGSAQRRKALCPSYKANRAGKANPFGDHQVPLVKELLPLLGVYQAQAENEEADDVIASLVRGELNRQVNYIVSTDRDFLQLVSNSTVLIVPKVGPREELIYDPDKVLQEYSIPVERILHLKAFLGDASDNLPGVSRVPEKVIKSLLKAHQTVEGVYKSNFSGVSPTQYQNLVEGRKRVLQNLDLMKMVTVDYTTVQPDCNFSQVSGVLHQYDIQADSIVSPFEKANKGFLKT